MHTYLHYLVCAALLIGKLSASMPLEFAAGDGLPPVGVCVEDYDDLETVMLMQVHAGLEQAMVDRGIKPNPLTVPCQHRRLQLNSEGANCSNDTQSGRCFGVPSFVQGSSYRMQLGVQMTDRLAEFGLGIGKQAASVSVTAYYRVDGVKTEKVVQVVTRPSRRRGRKDGAVQVNLRSPRTNNRTVVLESVWVRCVDCGDESEVESTASLDLIAQQSSSKAVSRRKRSTDSQRRKNLQIGSCKKHEITIDLQKIDRNIIKPFGSVIFSFCAGSCTTETAARHGIMHRFTGTVYGCCSPTGLERIKISVRNSTGVATLELPVRVTDCQCE